MRRFSSIAVLILVLLSATSPLCAAPVNFGAVGDSLTDEYSFWAPIAYDSPTALNWVDQIGTLGFGVNALEALAMGIPTCTGLVAGYAETVPDHPFVAVTADTLSARLADLIEDATARAALGQRGPDWVRRRHDAEGAARRIHALREASAARAAAPPAADAASGDRHAAGSAWGSA